jgi:bifunctional DNA-binding transcriptional regulator/antitoxin component of YhaV-PrlF toxin-antitoxin module
MGDVVIAKISSSDGTPLIYLPKKIREELGLYKGKWVKLFIENNRLVVEPLDLGEEEEG